MRTPLNKRIGRSIRAALRARTLSRFGKGILAETKNGLLVVDPRDFSVSRRLLSGGSYDWPNIRLLRRLIGDDARVVFVGSHIGALLVPLARKAGHVLGLEADPRNYSFLELNVLLNRLANVELVNCAVGERRGTCTVVHNDINSGNSRVSPAGDGEAVGATVEMKPLDDLVPREWSAIDLVVMDIEGYEVHAIRGASETLLRTRYFYVEYCPEQLEEQGSSREQFVDSLRERYRSMRIVDRDGECRRPEIWTEYLLGLPQRPGLLLNLLFSNDEG